MYAVVNGYFKGAETLIELGCDIDLKYNFSYSLLIYSEIIWGGIHYFKPAGKVT